MTNLFARANAWLGSTLAASAGVAVMLRRDHHRTPLTVWIGHTDAEKTVDGELVLATRIRNYLVDVTAYRINGQAVEPLRGDRITEADGAEYEILPPSGEPVWRWSDPQRTRYRIHARLVER